ncbi:hypothetical protein H632_c5523p0, partial [Helicosporidium sp. ATCC 50920]
HRHGRQGNAHSDRRRRRRRWSRLRVRRGAGGRGARARASRGGQRRSLSHAAPGGRLAGRRGGPPFAEGGHLPRPHAQGQPRSQGPARVFVPARPAARPAPHHDASPARRRAGRHPGAGGGAPPGREGRAPRQARHRNVLSHHRGRLLGCPPRRAGAALCRALRA